MKLRSNRFLSKTVFTVALFFGATFSALAFTEPASAPPAGNVNAPINTGSSAQLKAGSLQIQNFLDSGKLQLNTNQVWNATFPLILNSYTSPFGGQNVGIGTQVPIGTLDVENATNNAKICLNGECVTSLLGGGGGGSGTNYWTLNSTNIYNNVGDYTSAVNSTTGGWDILYLMPGLSAGSWNSLTKAGDAMLMWRGADIDTATQGLVLGPWSASAKGMRIDSTGNVGIGTAAPTQKLDVAGNVNVSTGNCFMVNGVCISSGSSQWTTSGNNIYSNTSNVGIGTASPAYNLDIAGDVIASNWFRVRGDNGIYWETAGRNGGWYMTDATWMRTYPSGGTVGIWANNGTIGTDGSLTVGYGGVGTAAGSAVIAGKVGIGTLNPVELLDVSGGASATIRLTGSGTTFGPAIALNSSGSAGHNWAIISSQSTNGPGPLAIGSLVFYDATANADRLIIHPNGNVGIGVVPGSFYKLDVNGGANFNGTLVATYLWSNGPIGATGDISTNTDIHARNVYANNFIPNSDERLKKDIAPLAENLNKVLQLRPVSYLWKDTASGKGTQIGFIAQEVQKVVPEVVFTNPHTGLEGLDYAHMTPLLVGSVQELNQKIDAQQKEIDELRAQVAALQSK
ncbi:MAG: tail fiber domain-containing protein [bacterium]|nr:tail fiber domain-containing protein [bacterium]